VPCDRKAANRRALGRVVPADSLIGPLGQRPAAGGVMVDRIRECRDAAVVHVGSGDGNVSQCRRFELAYPRDLAPRCLLCEAASSRAARRYYSTSRQNHIKTNHESTYVDLFCASTVELESSSRQGPSKNEATIDLDERLDKLIEEATKRELALAERTFAASRTIGREDRGVTGGGDFSARARSGASGRRTRISRSQSD
jgi:hypothetical protein